MWSRAMEGHGRGDSARTGTIAMMQAAAEALTQLPEHSSAVCKKRMHACQEWCMRPQSAAWMLHLMTQPRVRPRVRTGEQGEENSRADAEPHWHIAADIVEAHGIADGRKRLPNSDRRDLHARVDGSADWTTERIPRLVIEPVEEGVPTIRSQVLGRTVVEPGVCTQAGGIGVDEPRPPPSWSGNDRVGSQ